MRVGVFVVFCTIFIVLIPFVSGKILFEESFEEIYNIEDSIVANFSIGKLRITGDYVEMFLDCGEEKLIYKKYQKVEEGAKRYFYIEFPASVEGDCRVRIEFDKETINSQVFDITDRIDVEYSLNNKVFFPLEEVSIVGSAVKESGEPLDGLIFVYIKDLVNKTLEVKEGNFSLNFAVKGDAFPKEYKLEVSAIEKNQEEEIINYGIFGEEIEVRPRPSSIYIDVKESIKPPLNVSIKAGLLDQAGNLIKNESIIIKISNPLGEIVFDGSSESNESLIYSFKNNAMRGGWYLNSYYGSVHSIKPIYIEENKKIKVEIINEGGSYIQIENIGNIDYGGVVDVFIENDSYNEGIPINVNLSLGERFLHPLNLEGYYNLSVSDGVLGESFEEVYLSGITGAAIGVGKGRGYLFLLILILGFVVGYVVYKKEGVKWIKEKIPKKQGLSEGVEMIKETREEVKEKKAYMAVFKIGEGFGEIEDIARKYKVSLSKIGGNLYFVLFYSYPQNKPEEKIFQLSNEIRRKAVSKGVKFSIAINSDKFEEKLSFLKEFSLVTRKLVNFVEGNILVRDTIFDKLDVSTTRDPRMFKIGEQTIRAYIL